MTSDTFVFKNAEAAVQYASQFCDTELRPGATLVAEVLNTPRPQRDAEGKQAVLIKVASTDENELLIPAWTVGSSGPDLVVGDLICWLVLGYEEGLAKHFEDKRNGWVGAITAKLTLELDLEKGWKIACLFD